MKAKNNNNEPKGTLLSGAAWLTASVIIVKIIGFIYKMPLSHLLGDEGMGYFNSAYSIFAFFYMICSGGVPRAVTITVTETSVKGSEADANRILRVSLGLFVTVGVLFSLCLMLFSKFFAGIIGNSLAAMSLFCIAPSLAFVSAAGVLRGYLNGKGKISSIALAEVIEGAVKFIFGLMFALVAYRRGASAPIISAFTILGVALGAFAGALFMTACVKNAKSEQKTEQNGVSILCSKDIIKNILKISIPITLSSAIMGITNLIDLGMIMRRLESSGLSGAEAVALYGNFTTLAIPMLNLVIALITPISTAAMPRLASSFASSDDEEYSTTATDIISFTGIVVFPISAVYFLFSEQILTFLFAEESAKIAAPLLSLLAPSVVFMPFLTMINTILESSSHPRLPLISMSIGAVLKIIVGYIAIGSIGIAGAPISTCVCYGAALIISTAFACCRLKMDFSLVSSVFVPFIAASIAFGGGYFAYNYFTDGAFDILKLLLILAFSSIVYAFFICIFMRNKLRLAVNYVKIAKNKEKSL